MYKVKAEHKGLADTQVGRFASIDKRHNEGNKPGK